jgi:hypothetical protein
MSLKRTANFLPAIELKNTDTNTYLDPEDVRTIEMATYNLQDKLLNLLFSRLGSCISRDLALSVDDTDFTDITIPFTYLKRRLNLSCTDCGLKLGSTYIYRPGCGMNVEKAVSKKSEHHYLRSIVLPQKEQSVLEGKVDRLINQVNSHQYDYLFSINMPVSPKMTAPITTPANKGKLPVAVGMVESSTGLVACTGTDADTTAGMAFSTGSARDVLSNKVRADTARILGFASGVESSLSTLKLLTGLRPSTLTGSAGITGGMV